MHRLNRTRRALLVLMLALVFFGAACSDDTKDGGKSAASESKIREGSYDNLVAAAPAHKMTNPVTRNTINFWIDTWDEPGRLAFLYILQPTGRYGYYIFEGPPVTLCAALSPPYKFVDPKGDGEVSLFQVPAPSLDGVYYSGGQCNTYYGKDAETGAYIEFSVGQGQNYTLATEPIPNLGNDSTPLGFATLSGVKGEVKPSVDKKAANG